MRIPFFSPGDVMSMNVISLSSASLFFFSAFLDSGGAMAFYSSQHVLLSRDEPAFLFWLRILQLWQPSWPLSPLPLVNQVNFEDANILSVF